MVKRSLLGLLLLVVCVAASADENSPNLQGFTNGTGQARTFNANGAIDTANPFFQDLGANGRRCVTCHEAHTGWSITPEHVEARFAISHGDDPLFRNNDGSNGQG